MKPIKRLQVVFYFSGNYRELLLWQLDFKTRPIVLVLCV